MVSIMFKMKYKFDFEQWQVKEMLRERVKMRERKGERQSRL